MNNEIAVYQPLPLSEIIQISNAFAASGLFKDAADAAKCIVKVQAGNEIGIPPFAAMTGIHIIQGKPSIGAGIMAARVKGSGKYDYKVLTTTKEVCKIEFFEGKKSLGVSEFTLADAQTAGTQNMAKWGKAMLFARAMSQGVRTHCPDIFSGPVYVHGEIEGDTVTEDADVEIVSLPKDAVSDKVVVMQQPAKSPEPQKTTLDALHPDWIKVIGWVKEGGEIDKLHHRYFVKEDVVAMLKSVQPTKAPEQVTQQQIHEQNGTYAPPADPYDRPF